MKAKSGIRSLLWGSILISATVGCEDANNGEAGLARRHQPPVEAERPEGFQPRTDWPDALKSVVKVLKARHASPRYVDFQYANPKVDNPYSDGFYWRMPANDQAIDAHIDTFDLEKTTAGSHLTSKMFVRYPESWPRPDPERVIWYAGPHNRDDQAIDAHFWEILIHDEQSDMLYFFYWVWDIGI